VSRTIRIAALQLRAHDRTEFENVLPSILERLAEAAKNHDLVVAPEGSVPAYVLGPEPVDESLLARTHEQVAAIAREHSCTIVIGTALRREGELYNGALVFDADGRVAGSAEKIFLWHFDRQWFSVGSSIVPVDTAAGRLGVLICADGRMPAIARTLVDRGAEILVMPTAWVTSGRNPAELENIQADLLARVRAFENGVPFVAANKSGTELGMVLYCGKSQIVSPDGTVIAMGSQTQETLVSASVTTGALASHRSHAGAIGTRTMPTRTAMRIAISHEPLPDDIDARLRVLEAHMALSDDAHDHFDRFDDALGAVRCDAELAYDPGYLVAYRRAGYRAAVLDAVHADPWLERIARARAAELRMYVIVFDRSAQRAYAVDPDGVVIAGTTGDFRIASFALDPARTQQTLVAPGTDVAEGIERVAHLSDLATR
jgi:predicted amidohydrolase